MPIETAQPLTPAEKRKVTSKDFRTIAVSAFGVNANDNLIQLVFGLEVTDNTTMEEIIVEEVRLVMTPRTLKTVQLTLTNLVQGLEEIIGEIPSVAPPPIDVAKKPQPPN